MASLSVDYVLTFALAVILGVKYVAFDKDTADLTSQVPSDASDDSLQNSSTKETSDAPNCSQLSNSTNQWVDSVASVEPPVHHSNSTEQGKL